MFKPNLETAMSPNIREMLQHTVHN